MTGIDRLRTLAGVWDEWGLGGSLTDIANQIERELREERDRWDDDLSEAQVSWNAVAGICLDMERHCLGHEGMEDSPVARWARELRDVLKSYTSGAADAQKPSWHDPAEDAGVTSDATKVTRYPAEDVSMSACDLLPEDEREAIAWVREHGGIDYVRAEWRSRVPRERYERRRHRLLGHIAECETALGRRNERIEELEGRVKALTNENAELRKRAMPEGVEWPRHESGELVGFGDDVSRLGEDFEANVIALYRDGSFSLNFWAYSKGERVRRPAVPAADGEPLEVGQTVWDKDDETDTPLTVVEVSSDLVRCEYTWKDGKTYRPCYPPSALTHTKPEIDTWQRIEEDSTLSPEVYCHRNGIDISQKDGTEIFLADTVEPMARDIVRRCRALAERERGE